MMEGRIMMDISCDKCGEGLTTPGGLAFSPPTYREVGDDMLCRKYHLCIDCWTKFKDWMRVKKVKKRRKTVVYGPSVGPSIDD